MITDGLFGGPEPVLRRVHLSPQQAFFLNAKVPQPLGTGTLGIADDAATTADKRSQAWADQAPFEQRGLGLTHLDEAADGPAAVAEFSVKRREAGGDEAGTTAA